MGFGGGDNADVQPGYNYDEELWLEWERINIIVFCRSCSAELHRSLGLRPTRARGPVLQHLQHVFGNSAQWRCDCVRDVLLQTFQWVVTNLTIHARTATQFQNPSQHAARDYTSCFAILNIKKIEERREQGGPGLQNSLHQPWVLRNPSGGGVVPNNHALDPVFGRPGVQIPPHLMNYFPPDIKKGIGRHTAWKVADVVTPIEFARRS
ncbi:uncharacterized protein LOC142775195 [Rhipicephalus microplus]|uniref:uncharacterized protein LOC142775195 n=1 Tax=Rhipicephalus microplus TaxID=6941 RepID=UPI003F6CC31C